MELNYQTKTKLENIKKSIVAKEDLKEIIKKYWTNSKNKKNQWLEKYKNYFNAEELTYLDYSDTTSENTVVSELTNKLTKLDKNELVLPEEFNFFKDKENLKVLIEIVTKYKNQQEVEIIEAGKVNIPDEVKKLSLNGNIAVKSNLELYEKIKKMAYHNGVGIGQFITYILFDFYKKHN